jgi:hypothetical protein
VCFDKKKLQKSHEKFTVFRLFPLDSTKLSRKTKIRFLLNLECESETNRDPNSKAGKASQTQKENPIT